MATTGINPKGGRPRVSRLWEDAVRTIYANEEPISSEAVRHHVEDLEHAWRRNDGPKPRTIRLLKQRFDALPTEERQQYRLLYWPESVQRGALPPEASSACLELLSYYEQHGRGRPPIRLARWYWHVSQVIEEDAGSAESSWMIEPPFHRVMAASRLAALEALGSFAPQDEIRALEHWLAYAPWRSLDASKRYEDDAGVKFPRFRGHKPLAEAIPDETDPDRVRTALEILYGKMAEWAIRRYRRKQQKGGSK